MGDTSARARYETQLARAHRSLFFAQQCADEIGDMGAALDVGMILQELTRLGEDSLRTNRARDRSWAKRYAALPESDN